MQPRPWPALALLISLFASSPARADSWAAGDEDALDEAIDDGDIDHDDWRTPRAARVGRVPAGTNAMTHGWISLVGFTRRFTSGQNDLGAMVIVGLPLDRLAAGSTHASADAPPPPASPAPSLVELSTSSARPLRAPRVLARECVLAALRASGLGLDDSRIDDLVSRARASAWLPETRARALRLVTDASRATTLATTDGTSYYAAVGAHLVLELRLTWRLDRLLYGGDEPALERLRLERQEARSRLARRTLEVLFAWQRAVVDLQSAVSGSSEEVEAQMRASEAQGTLDVLTDGWFSRRGEPSP
jgi:hypothetical protein